jgi:serine/threonine protein kinase
MRALGPGARLGDGLEVIAHIARSNVIDVYDAWSELRGCRVAVKALRPDRLHDVRARAALLGEGRLLARLAHPHLVRAYEVHDGARPVVVLETLRGATLAALIARRRLSSAETAHLGLQVGSALRHLGGQGLVHLDVKPSNVIAHAGTAKLIDLSIARRPGIVKPGLGTWSNLAPEQARGGFAGPAADVWGLGTVLYEALAGEPPFGDDDEGDYPCVDRRADPVRRHRPRAPRALAEAIDAALEPEPLDRPEIEELLDILDAHAGRPNGPGRWPLGREPEPARRSAAA